MKLKKRRVSRQLVMNLLVRQNGLKINIKAKASECKVPYTQEVLPLLIYFSLSGKSETRGNIPNAEIQKISPSNAFFWPLIYLRIIGSNSRIFFPPELDVLGR
jgi:hypothetical protein